MLRVISFYIIRHPVGEVFFRLVVKTQPLRTQALRAVPVFLYDSLTNAVTFINHG